MSTYCSPRPHARKQAAALEVNNLLVAFREAAEIEHRLIELERWLAHDRPKRDTLAYWRKWTVCSMRLLKLVSSNPRLTPYHDAAHAYLLAIHEAAQ